MKRFEFRLERVLKLKRQRERLVELRQQRARLMVETVEARILAIRNELTRNSLGLVSKIGQALPAGSWQGVQLHAISLDRELEKAEAELRRAMQELEQAAAALRQAVSEVEALLYLRRRAKEAHHDAVERAEQVRLDELGLQRWQAARDSAEGEFS